MQRNEESRFGTVPTVNIPRSGFYFQKPIRTTFDSGELVPFYCNQDIMPGDTYSFDFTAVIRQTTPITPTMDLAVADVYCFFQRMFNLWSHWKEFWGENPNGMWTDNAVEYTIPQIEFGYTSTQQRNIQVGDIADHLGLPLTFSASGDNRTISVSALPFRMNVQVWNNFFRNQNLQAPMKEYTGDSTAYTLSDSARSTYNWLNPHSNYQNNGYAGYNPTCAPVNKLADYFTTLAIQPQRGDAVSLPLGTMAPVSGIFVNQGAEGDNLTARAMGNSYIDTTLQDGSGKYGVGFGYGIVYTSNDSGAVIQTKSGSDLIPQVYADLSNAVASTVNALRLSFATQRILERDIYGSRYFERIRNFFHVTSPYAVQTVPEYLGGFRIGINQTQVAQTSSTDATSPQGNVAAYSLTTTDKHLFTKSFTEHGILMFYVVVRNKNSYDQGIERQWSRLRRLDYYHPPLANLGYQAVKSKEIYADGTANDEGTFGFGPHWNELRYERPMNTGLFHTTAQAGLSFWHYGDHYQTRPTLSAQWSISDKSNIARTLAVQNEPQYLMDSLLTIKCYRPITADGVPGLIDHY